MREWRTLASWQLNFYLMVLLNVGNPVYNMYLGMFMPVAYGVMVLRTL